MNFSIVDALTLATKLKLVLPWIDTNVFQIHLNIFLCWKISTKGVKTNKKYSSRVISQTILGVGWVVGKLTHMHMNHASLQGKPQNKEITDQTNIKTYKSRGSIL